RVSHRAPMICWPSPWLPARQTKRHSAANRLQARWCYTSSSWQQTRTLTLDRLSIYHPSAGKCFRAPKIGRPAAYQLLNEGKAGLCPGG
ncbi:MAG: hypothetical protein AB7U73_17190, partial [Pirellulales bacterium]